MILDARPPFLVAIVCSLGLFVVVWWNAHQTSSDELKRQPTVDVQAAERATSPIPATLEPMIVGTGPLPPTAVIPREPSPPAVTPEDERLALSMKFRGDPSIRRRENAETTATIRDAFRLPSSKGADLERVECHDDICELTITFASFEADRDVIRSLFGDPKVGLGSLGGAVIPTRETLADGRVKATMYLARQGELRPF